MRCLKIHRAAGTHELLTCSTQAHRCLSHDGEFRVKNSNRRGLDHDPGGARRVYCKHSHRCQRSGLNAYWPPSE